MPILFGYFQNYCVVLMKQFSVKVPNQPGSLAKVADALAHSVVNIKAIASERRDGYGLIHVVTQDENSTREALQKERLSFDESELLVLSLIDRPGELAKYTKKMSEAGINVDNIYILGGNTGKTEVAMRVDDLGRTDKAIRQICSSVIVSCNF